MMKSSLKKLRGLGLRKQDQLKEKRKFLSSTQLDELVQASQDLEDIRNFHDSLVSVAAVTANSAYEFSESLQEMGACLLEKTASSDDEEIGRVLLSLGKVQYELRKLVDCYRSHIVQTISTPSESLLNELRNVEEMKHQCFEKRNAYVEMIAAAQGEKQRSRNVRGDHILPQQLQTAYNSYNEEAILYIFRMQSIKQGHPRSLLTQAARHHAAQVNFFKKALKSLEAVEPHVKLVTEKQHIDYQLSGFEDDDLDDVYDDDGRLSFDYGHDDKRQHDVLSRNSMELDQVEHTPLSTTESLKENLDDCLDGVPVAGYKLMAGSQSAPIFPNKKYDPEEKMTKNMQPSSTKKFHSYVLPTPLDAKGSSLAKGSSNRGDGSRQTNASIHELDTWHLSSMNLDKPSKDITGHSLDNLQSMLKESDINSSSLRCPPPLAEGLTFPQLGLHTNSDHKKIKRHAFSDPLESKSWSSKQVTSSSDVVYSAEKSQSASTKHGQVLLPQPFSSAKDSSTVSTLLKSSPKINELHKLPRPPTGLGNVIRPCLTGHSEPLISRNQEYSAVKKVPLVALHVPSPLPMPPGTVARSFSTPSNSQRVVTLNVTKLLGHTKNPDLTEDVSSPPLTPIPFVSMHPILLG